MSVFFLDLQSFFFFLIGIQDSNNRENKLLTRCRDIDIGTTFLAELVNILNNQFYSQQFTLAEELGIKTQTCEQDVQYSSFAFLIKRTTTKMQVLQVEKSGNREMII